jgi:hypothetical protein
LAASQILSVVWALTTNTDEKIKIIARIKTGIGFIGILRDRGARIRTPLF